MSQSETAVGLTGRPNTCPTLRLHKPSSDKIDEENSALTLKNTFSSLVTMTESTSTKALGSASKMATSQNREGNQNDDSSILRSIHAMCANIQQNFSVMEERITNVELTAKKNHTIITKTHQELIKENEVIYRRLNSAEKEIVLLKKRPQETHPDPRRQQTLIISGIPKESQNVNFIKQVFTNMGVTLNGHINLSTLQNGKTAVQFSTFWDRNAVYKARTKLSSANRGIFINENLTSEQAKIFYLARAAKKQKLIHNAWTKDGITFISKVINGNTQVAEVRDEPTLSVLVPKFEVPEERQPKKQTKNQPAEWTGGDHQPQQRPPRIEVEQVIDNEPEEGEIQSRPSSPEPAESTSASTHDNVTLPASNRRKLRGDKSPTRDKANPSASSTSAEKHEEKEPETAEEDQNKNKAKTSKSAIKKHKKN